MSKDNLISDSLAQEIANFIRNEIKRQNRRALPAVDIFKRFQKEIAESANSSLQENDLLGSFRKSLSQLCGADKLGNIKVLLGRNGGYGPEKPRAESAPTSAPVEVAHHVVSSPEKTPEAALEPPESKMPEPPARILAPQPLPVRESFRPAKNVQHLEIAGQKYDVPESEGRLHSVLTKVFGAIPDESGDIVLDGVRFRCPDESARQYLDNFVFYCMGAAHVIEQMDKKSA